MRHGRLSVQIWEKIDPAVHRRKLTMSFLLTANDNGRIDGELDEIEYGFSVNSTQ